MSVLNGIRVIELGQLIAGPYAGMLLAAFGAEVIKVEAPSGDPIRAWRGIDGGTSLWWRSLSRNKRCIAVDLRRPAGRDLVRALIRESDVLIENFRPGTLERWGLDPAALREADPKLIVARVSGYGQTGPKRSEPGYASVCEAFGGLRHLTGEPGVAPVRANLSLGDTLAGLHAALGVLLALFHRERAGSGQQIDAAIYEAVFSVLESTLPEYDRLGVVRQASGASITGVVPTGTYPCKDGKRVVIGANGEAVFGRLCHAIGRADMASDPRMRGNAARVLVQAEIDDAIARWTASCTADEALAALQAATVPCSVIYDAADIHRDPHYAARGMFDVVDVDGPLKIPAVVPKLSDTPARTEHPGRDLGADTDAVLSEVLGLDAAAIGALRQAGTVA